MAASFSLFNAIKLSGDNTGGSLNPAIGLAQNVFLKIYDKHDHKTWKILLVHILGPLLGGIIAAPVFWPWACRDGFAQAKSGGRVQRKGTADDSYPRCGAVIFYFFPLISSA